MTIKEKTIIKHQPTSNASYSLMYEELRQLRTRHYLISGHISKLLIGYLFTTNSGYHNLPKHNNLNTSYIEVVKKHQKKVTIPYVQGDQGLYFL
jgi:hypothetical protein